MLAVVDMAPHWEPQESVSWASKAIRNKYIALYRRTQHNKIGRRTLLSLWSEIGEDEVAGEEVIDWTSDSNKKL